MAPAAPAASILRNSLLLVMVFFPSEFKCAALMIFYTGIILNRPLNVKFIWMESPGWVYCRHGTGSIPT
jgi:hypothetical protein